MKVWLKGGLIGAGIGLVLSLLIFFLDSSFYPLLDWGRTLYNVFFSNFSFSFETSNLIFNKIVLLLFLFPIVLGFILGGLFGRFKSSKELVKNRAKRGKKKR